MGCTGNITEAQLIVADACLSATHINAATKSIKINGDKLYRPYVKASVTSGSSYTLNYYHTETNCLADSNAVETIVGSLGTCLTEDDHNVDDATTTGTKDIFVTPNVARTSFGPNNVIGQTNRILVGYIPASYSCNSPNDDNYCSISSGGIAGIVVAVVFTLFLLLVILFMAIRYCGKATPAPAPTVTLQSPNKGEEGNPLLSGI